MATNAAVRRPVPGSYSEMFPGRFLKADAMKGKKVTLTIKAIFGEDLISAEEEQTKPEWIVQFIERPLEWVMNKTNAFCLFRMFGGDPQSWIGHKVTLFPKPGTWFGEKGEAIRVWGSPELTEDLPITLKFMRKKAEKNMVLHRVETKPTLVQAPATPLPPGQVDIAVHPKLVEAFGFLGWNADVRVNWLRANSTLSDDEKLSKLQAELDKE